MNTEEGVADSWHPNDSIEDNLFSRYGSRLQSVTRDASGNYVPQFTAQISGAGEEDPYPFELLNPLFRPTWTASGHTSGGKNKSTVAKVENQSYDIFPFVNRSKPTINHVHTIGGLEKRATDACWSILHNKPSGDKTGKKLEMDQNTSQGMMGLKPSFNESSVLSCLDCAYR